MTSTRQPQLCMVRSDLNALPVIRVAEGYRIRSHQPGDVAHWVQIIAESFQADPAAISFDKIMRQDPAFRPDRIFYACCGEEPVGTTAAYIRPAIRPRSGMIHYVGVRSGHGGKGLGQALMGAALNRMREEGWSSAWLTTDDFRLAAIKLYAGLGFIPQLTHDSHRDRWEAVIDALHAPDLRDRWAESLSAPLWKAPEPEPDLCDYSKRLVPRWRWHTQRPVGTLKNDEVTARSDESLYHPSRLGTAGTDCPSVIAGENRTWRLWYQAGDTPLGAGVQVRFYCVGQRSLGDSIQCMQPDQSGYVEIESAPASLRLKATVLGFEVEAGEMRAGDRVVLRIGREKGFSWTPLAGRKDLSVIVHVGRGEPQCRLPEPVVIRVLPDTAERVEILLPGTRPAGGAVTATVTVRDRFDNRVPWSGLLPVTVDGRAHAVPLVEGWGRGGITPEGGGSLRAEAAVPGAQVAGVSNVCREATGRQLYFGDLHSHDSTSEAEGTMSDAYAWARDEKRLDFLSQSVQCHNFIDNEKWHLVRQLAETYLDEGRFVTFPAFEWQHSRFGDKIIHYLGGDAPYLPVDDPRYAHPAALYEAVRGSDAFIVSHHPGYVTSQWIPGTDFERMETDVDRALELWSMHGSSEGYDPADRPLRGARREEGVMLALRRGLRVALLAGSDTHASRPGGSAKEPCGYWGGLCAVWADALTRRGLFEAFRARRTYALTRARIGLMFMVNGACMGSEIPFAREVRLAMEVWAPGPIERIDLLKNTRPWKSVRPDRDETRIEEEDRIDAPAFYHVRVTLKDGNLAVSTPVWVG